MKKTIVLTLFVNLVAASVLPAAPGDAGAREQRVTAPLNLDDDGEPTGPTTCPSLCTPTSSCSKSCRIEGAYTTCGNFGVCVSCASYCTANAYCASKACMQGGALTSCQATGRECHACSASNCDGSPLRCGDGRTCSVTTPSGRTYPSCEAWASTTADKDLDQVPDALELALARRFFPLLNMRYPIAPAGCTGPYPYADACNYFNEDSYGQFYGTTLSSEFGGGLTNLPFAVRPYQDATPECDESFECLEIAYTLLYNYDYGDTFGGSHRGDSESVAVLVSRNLFNTRRGLYFNHPWAEARLTDADWALIKVNAAKHMCDGGAPTFYDDLEGRIYTRIPYINGGGTYLISDYEPLGSTPLAGLPLWVAEFKNATYFSQYRCNVGNNYMDDCTTDRRWLTAAQHAAAQADLVNAGESGCHSSFTPYVQGPSLYPPMMGPYGSFPSGAYPIWSAAKFGQSSPLFHKMKEGTFKWDAYDYVCH